MVHYRINRELRLFEVRYTGATEVADWERAVTRAIAECPEVRTFDSINDGRTGDTIMEFSRVQAIAEINNGLGLHLFPRKAVTLTGSTASFGIARMSELITEDRGKVQRFATSSIDDAARFLGLTSAVLQAELDALVEQGGGS